jgi:primosomal protein N' (replication factor Y)
MISITTKSPYAIRALTELGRSGGAGPVPIGEIARRRALRYPPFGHLIRIVCLSEEAGPEVEAAAALRGLIALEAAQILGPAPLFRLQGRERSQLVVKAADRTGAVRAVREAVERVAGDRRHKGVAFAVDVDPQ